MLERYLNSLDNKKESEWLGTRREFAELDLYRFFRWGNENGYRLIDPQVLEKIIFANILHRIASNDKKKDS